MADKTVYPFGTNGTLPGNIKLVDFYVGGRDKALDAESGKELHEMILERTDTYGELVAVENYTNSMVNTQGEIGSLTNGFVKGFPIDLVNNKYLASFGYGASQTNTYSLNYYDAEWNYLGGAVINPGGEPAAVFTLAPLVYPDSWSGNEETYEAQAAYLRITGYSTTRPANLYETWTVPQSILAREVTPNVINLFVATIQSPMLGKLINNNTEITTVPTASPWAVVFPETYSVGGTPTPVIAMLHGGDGRVGEDCMGYTTTEWITWRSLYLAAGFAVMDINGYGVSTQVDAKSKHWGGPLAIETLDKAWDFLRQNFNVCDKLLVHGTSMGGVLAMNYAKVFPGKVAAVGCFAPVLFAYSMRYTEDATKYPAWGYIDHEAAEADDYNNLTGYVVLNESLIVDDETMTVSKFEWSDYPYEDRNQVLTKKLIDRFPVPLRIWQGTSDQTVYPSFTALIFNSLMRGNSPVSLRQCNGAGHNLASVSYVRNEAVSYFKRFAVQYP